MNAIPLNSPLTLLSFKNQHLNKFVLLNFRKKKYRFSQIQRDEYQLF